jgi:hypothetical protein
MNMLSTYFIIGKPCPVSPNVCMFQKHKLAPRAVPFSFLTPFPGSWRGGFPCPKKAMLIRLSSRGHMLSPLTYSLLWRGGEAGPVPQPSCRRCVLAEGWGHMGNARGKGSIVGDDVGPDSLVLSGSVSIFSSLPLSWVRWCEPCPFKTHVPIQAWVCTPVIPATQELEAGRSWFEVNLGKVSTRPYLKNN